MQNTNNTDLSFQWNANENLRLWEKILSLTSAVMAGLLIAFNYWLFHGEVIPFPWVILLWTVVLYVSTARFRNWWPYSASSFLYFRGEQILYRTAISTYSLKQGTINIAAIQSVFVTAGTIRITTSNDKHVLIARHFPPEIWDETHHVFLQKLNAYPDVRISRLVDQKRF